MRVAFVRSQRGRSHAGPAQKTLVDGFCVFWRHSVTQSSGCMVAVIDTREFLDRSPESAEDIECVTRLQDRLIRPGIERALPIVAGDREVWWIDHNFFAVMDGA